MAQDLPRHKLKADDVVDEESMGTMSITVIIQDSIDSYKNWNGMIICKWKTFSFQIWLIDCGLGREWHAKGWTTCQRCGWFSNFGDGKVVIVLSNLSGHVLGYQGYPHEFIQHKWEYCDWLLVIGRCLASPDCCMRAGSFDPYPVLGCQHQG